MAKIVVALGGNALGNNAAAQMRKARVAARAVADLIAQGHEVLIGHGNGPQVGQIKLAFDEHERRFGDEGMPFAECTAMSQGYIGYHLQTALEAELAARGIYHRPVVSLITRVLVDANDPAFKNPTKPVGGYYDEAAAQKLSSETGDVYREDAGRGWRRMVASPLPVDVLEKTTVNCLMENHRIVIACGGGGVPVVSKEGMIVGVEAVIDKDFAAAKMADLINADLLFILTAIERVMLDFRKPEARAISRMTADEARKYCEEGHFAPGSMLPKVMAACMFVEGGAGRRAVIGLLEQASAALRGESGTTIQ